MTPTTNVMFNRDSQLEHTIWFGYDTLQFVA